VGVDEGDVGDFLRGLVKGTLLKAE
jgi:hypothetical protein